MNTPALTIGAAPARQSGNTARTAMKTFFLLSVTALISTIYLAVKVQTAKSHRHMEGPGFILSSLADGKTYTCKIVSIEETGSSILTVRVVGKTRDGRWQKEGMVLVVRNECVLKVDDVVRLSYDRDKKIMIETPPRFELVLLL